MCVPNSEFQLINPTTQVALYSICIDNCSTVQSITWNIYQGRMNLSSNFTQWNLFNQTNFWFFGKDDWFIHRKYFICYFRW
jgi:hypothetical protein